LQLYIIASILILIGLVFLVIGLNQDTILWQIGLSSNRPGNADLTGEKMGEIEIEQRLSHQQLTHPLYN
jgi:hypothetical protein